ncbi:M20/M25/M40 family metallo-hydrolase [Barnesiella viscericola]|uniref:M20/M25/M40 family metallo-hydrolase n=1 Tax=Barnesiella viscericola TaxID=397865 RepID=UPI0025A32C9C|nr:M20/M25/M40 family metallo-hydrolase [Barnesiella viscericola]MDM8267771.1 M20/M25/M40 family metallo-hydrolase [Barnesiella viscericola]
MELSRIVKSLFQFISPSGNEETIAKTLKEYVVNYVDSIYQDAIGNLICTKYSKDPQTNKTIMFVAHMDEIGLMVTYIEESGYIRFTRIGGVDLMLLKGRNVKIVHGDAEILGVIGTTPIHMRRNGNNKDLEESDLWIDIGITDKEEVEKLISIGDCIVIDAPLVELPNQLISSRACDNKAGVVSLIRMLDLVKDDVVGNNIVLVFSAQEEVGLRGAKTATYSASPDVCIAVDVAHATDYPTVNKSKYGDVRIGKGPVIPVGSDLTPYIQKELKNISQNLGLDYQLVALSGCSGTDANAAQVTMAGCATGLISIPCRYMHSPVEVVSLSDIENVAQILAEFCRKK